MFSVEPFKGNEIKKVDGNWDDEKGIIFMLRIGKISPRGESPYQVEKAPEDNLEDDSAINIVLGGDACFFEACTSFSYVLHILIN